MRIIELFKIEGLVGRGAGICTWAASLQSTHSCNFQASPYWGSIIFCTLPPKHRALSVSVALPWRCACLEGDTHGCVMLKLPVAFAGAGNHVFDWLKAAGEGHLGMVTGIG